MWTAPSNTVSVFACVSSDLDYTDRAGLYDRINRRVDQMLHMGLVEEAKQVLSEQDGKTALQAIGYKELLPYFQGDFTLEEAVEHMKRETRRYAKRQLTWFRRKANTWWTKWKVTNSLVETTAKIDCNAI
ncbi:MAG: tRNA dimethylallyltransferase [Eubacteriales bacterium]